MLVWFKKPNTSPRLKQINKDHTVYCSGEVYSNTFKMRKSSHEGNNFSSFFFFLKEDKRNWPPRSPDFELYTQSSINKYIHVQVKSRQKIDSNTQVDSAGFRTNWTNFMKTETFCLVIKIWQLLILNMLMDTRVLHIQHDH